MLRSLKADADLQNERVLIFPDLPIINFHTPPF